MDHRDTLYSMWGVAVNLLKLGKGEEAIPVIDECLRRATGPAAEPSFSNLAEKRLRYFESAKNADGCRTTAELWEQLPCTDPESRFNSARYRAVAAALYRTSSNTEAIRLADEQADRAMTWLQKAVVAGYKDLTVLTKEKDLDSLRGREDFKKIMAELELKEKAGMK